MKKISPKLKNFLLAVYFVLGGTFTFELTVERVRENTNLYAIMTVLAIVFDALFFKLFFSLFKEKALPTVMTAVGKVFYAVFRRIGRLVEKVNDALSPNKDKTCMDGKSERTFVFETHTGGAGQTRRKLPKLQKDATERQKIRYAYTCYVFKKDKNMSSALTPNEVALQLDENGEEKTLFENYNEARYTEE
jgi:hypothetical protein